MDNPETLATLGTQDTGQRETTQKHNTNTNTNSLLSITTPTEELYNQYKFRYNDYINLHDFNINNIHRKLKRWATRTPPNTGVNPGGREG